MVKRDTVAKNIFRVVEQILLEYIQNQAHGYFELQGFGHVTKVLPNPLAVSDLTQLSGGSSI